MAEQDNQVGQQGTITGRLRGLADLNTATYQYWNDTISYPYTVTTADTPLAIHQTLRDRIEELTNLPTLRVPLETIAVDDGHGVSIRHNTWANNINIITRFTAEELCQLKRKIITEIARRVAKDFIRAEEPTLQAIRAEFLAKLPGD